MITDCQKFKWIRMRIVAITLPSSAIMSPLNELIWVSENRIREVRNNMRVFNFDFSAQSLTFGTSWLNIILPEVWPATLSIFSKFSSKQGKAFFTRRIYKQVNVVNKWWPNITTKQGHNSLTLQVKIEPIIHITWQSSAD